MIVFCAFCLSHDRKVSKIDDKYWKTVVNCFTNINNIKLIEDFESDPAWELCWECAGRLRSFYKFISTSQYCVQILYNYLQHPEQNEPSSISALTRSEVETINYVHTKRKADNVPQTSVAFYKDSLLPDFQTKITPKIETSAPDDYFIEIDELFETAGEEDHDFADSKDVVSSKDVLQQLTDGLNVSKTSRESQTKNTSIKLVKSKSKTTNEEPSSSKGTKSKYTGPWLSTEEAIARYTEERNRERSLYPSRTHTCDACRRTFRERYQLNTHILDFHHESAGPLVCDICKCRFARRAQLALHLRVHFVPARDDQPPRIKRINRRKPSRATQCNRCKDEFGSSAIVREHKKKCNLYKCERCGKTYESNSSYYSHIKSHEPLIKTYADSEVYCQKCDIRFKRPEWLKNHLTKSLRHVPKDSLKHACSHCSARFLARGALRDHVSLVHLKKGKHQCDACPQSFNARSVLRRHRARQHGLDVDEDLNKICDVCGKAFYSNTLLTNHMRTHTGEKPYKCEFCDAAFAQNGSLYTHCRVLHKKKISTSALKISLGEKKHFDIDDSNKHVCEECGKDFTFAWKLRDHINYVHKGRTNYVCKYCNKAYGLYGSLAQHNRKAHGIAPKSRSNLQANDKLTTVKAASKERSYNCRECSKTFRQTGPLYLHYKLKHLKLKRGDKVRIRNLYRPDKEIIVEERQK